ncbi:MAG: hypothetical protein ACR2P1_09830, partial [Pseudomonadales bacterium]
MERSWRGEAEIHGVHPWTPPFGQPSAVQTGFPADLSWCASMDTTLRAAFGCANRLSCRFVMVRFYGHHPSGSLR